MAAARLNAAAIVESLGDTVDLLLDGGRAPGSRSSTVVRCERRSVTVLRAGARDRRDRPRRERAHAHRLHGEPLPEPARGGAPEKAVAERLACAVKDLPRFGHRLASFGTMAMVDKPATQESVVVGREHGVDLTRNLSRVFSPRLLASASRVYCLARNHMDFLLPYFADRPHALPLLDPKGREIHDPYGRPLKVYRRAGEQIARAVEKRPDEIAAATEEGGSGGQVD